MAVQVTVQKGKHIGWSQAPGPPQGEGSREEVGGGGQEGTGSLE